MSNITAWYLKNIDLFTGLTDDQLEYVSMCFIHTPLKARSMMRIPKESDLIYFVKKGVVELIAGEKKQNQVILDILKPGSYYAAQTNIHPVHILAKKEAVVCKMKLADFFKLISMYPGVSERFLQSFFDQNQERLETIYSISSETVVDRLLRLVKLLTRKKVDVAFTHQELADMIGTTRQTVTSLINCLKKEHKLKKVGNRYQLIDSSFL